MQKKYVRAFVFLCVLCAVESAKILGVFHFPMKSMHNLGSALMKGLAKKGHEVTMISPFPLKEPVPNYKDVEIPGLLQYKEENTMKQLVGFADKSSLSSVLTIDQQMAPVNLLALNSSVMQNILHSGEQFDLVILCWIFNEAFLGIAEHLKAPVILYTTTGENSLVHHMYGDHGSLSYIPHLFVTLTDEMTFCERIKNTLFSLAVNLFLNTVYLNRQNQMLKQFFPNSRSVQELIDDVPLILLNTHYSFDYARPHNPHVVSVGGLHVEAPAALPEDLQTFLDDAPDGVVFFSFGSNVKSTQLPRETLQIFIQAFRQLDKIKVLWKFDGSTKDLPANILTKTWMPQNDILAHPNIKCFITHGGLLSLSEAVHYGIPMVGIPFFGDQKHNILKATKMGFAVTVPFKELTVEKLIDGIQEVLNNGTYREMAQKRSTLLRDQPINPLDHSVYWVEYLLKHRDAKMLRTGGSTLNWFQYYLLDVIAFLILTLCILLVVVYYVIRMLKKLVVTLLCKKRKLD